MAYADWLPGLGLLIILYHGADYMSLFGYNRANTPELERLAEQGAVFERAYSAATWTKPSTASFMTSIPSSSLGGFRGETTRVPDAADTMAELLHDSGSGDESWDIMTNDNNQFLSSGIYMAHITSIAGSPTAKAVRKNSS